MTTQPWKKPSKRDLERLISRFNRDYPVGTKCRLRTDSGTVETSVIAPATMLGGHSPVAMFDGVSGAYSIEDDRVEPIPTTDPAVPQKHIELLVHMLGAGEHVRRSNHGYRNRFCAGVGGDDHRIMLEMEAAGLVVAGPIINGGRSQFFGATLAGCKAAGLSDAATERALE